MSSNYSDRLKQIVRLLYDGLDSFFAFVEPRYKNRQILANGNELTLLRNEGSYKRFCRIEANKRIKFIFEESQDGTISFYCNNQNNNYWLYVKSDLTVEFSDIDGDHFPFTDSFSYTFRIRFGNYVLFDKERRINSYGDVTVDKILTFMVSANQFIISNFGISIWDFR